MPMVFGLENIKNDFERHILKDLCLLDNSGLPCCGFVASKRDACFLEDFSGSSCVVVTRHAYVFHQCISVLLLIVL